MKIDLVQQGFEHKVGDEFLQMSQLSLALINEFIIDRQSWIKRPFKLLEYGSGASTDYFVKKYPEVKVYSVEGDKEWFEKVKGWCKPERYEYHKASPNYTTDPSCNKDYITCMEEYGPFDLILNDGAQREMVADYIFANHEKYIADGGMYLRHDYEMNILGNWNGLHLPGEKQTPEEFVVKHPEYSVVTFNGSGRWGYVCELGGVWKRENNK